MSNFPSAPPPGAYVPPTEGNHAPQASAPAPAPNPQQQYYQQQAQGPAPSYGGAPQHPGPHKSQGIGQMFNQAVTTGKPMFNKFSKQISAKLSGKQQTQATPQHLAGSYQNYQNHQQQQIPYQQPPQAQQSPQPPQQQWQPQPPQQPNTYPPSQQTSPFPPQSNYATPASANSGQSNYFPPQQTPQPPSSQAPPQQQQQQLNGPNHNPNQFAQGQNVGIQQPGQPGSGQLPQGHWQQPGQLNQGQPQVQPNQGQQQAPFSPVQHQVQPDQSQHPGQIQQTGLQHSQFSEQQTTGVISSSPSPHASNSTPNFPPQPISQHQPQQQWVPQSSPTPNHANPASPATPSPALQHAQPFALAPPSQPYGTAPTLPAHPNQPQSEVQQPLRPPPVPKQQQHQPQQWVPVSPTSPQGPAPDRIPPPPGPPPPETPTSQPPAQPSPMRLTGFPPPKPTAEPLDQIPSPRNEFVAELPGDLGNSQRPSPSPVASYQAYHPPTTGRGPSPGYVIPRRAVSMTSMPLADPWSIADMQTERPTREFYMIADLLFDALDKRFEPQNTGMLEATKILESWRVQELAEEAAQLFAYDSFSAFARLWSLEGVPHVMVPCQTSLTPCWDFRAQSHSHEMVIPPSPVPETQAYPSYMPALNRAGWYKYLFLELIVEPEGLHKMMPAFCGDTYKPNVLNQPDLQKRDRTELTGLVGRASAIRNAAMTRVCQETAKAMQVAREAGEKDSKGLVGREQEQEQEIALKMQQLKMQQQMSDMANQSTIAGGQSFSMAAGNNYMPRY